MSTRPRRAIGAIRERYCTLRQCASATACRERRPAIGWPFFGAILNVGGTVINGPVGGFSGGIGRALAANDRLARVYRWVTGCLLLGLAAKLAFERRQSGS